MIAADNRIYKSKLFIALPVTLIGTGRLGIMMAAGRGTSEGSGWLGFVVGVLALAAPLLGVVGFMVLRRFNAAIVLRDEVLTISNLWGWPVLIAPVHTITGLHHVRLEVGAQMTDQVVVASEAAKPFLIDMRVWQRDGKWHRLWEKLEAPIHSQNQLPTGKLASGWTDLRERFPGAPVPWGESHPRTWVLCILPLMIITVVGYIALIVNLPFILGAGSAG